MSARNATAYQTRIHQIVFGFFFIAAVAVAIRSLMFGAFSRAALIASVFAGIGLIVALQERYWLLLPFFAISNLGLRGLPFNGAELGCLIVIAVHFLRLGLKQDQPARFNMDLLIVLPFFFWILFVFFLNPVGLAMFGSDTIGGRFYFQIFVACMAFVAMSTQRIDEQSAKCLFFVILGGMLYSLGKGVLFPRADPDEAILLGEAAEASSRYAFTVCANIYMLLFARYALSDILISPGRMVIFAVLAMLTVFSGKRRSFGTLALVPLFRVFLEGKQKALTALMTCLAVLILAFAIAGDGTLYRLPKSARRALSVVVPKYETTAAAGMNDIFREHMREQARFVIHESPWFGRKGFAMNYKETAWMHFGGAKTDIFVGHAYAGNWHSTWYAYAADFGIPCMILWLLFTLYMIRYAYRACRTVTIGVWLPTCCLFYAMRILVDIAFSYTSGHSATTTLSTLISYGTLLAIVGGYRKAHFDIST